MLQVEQTRFEVRLGRILPALLDDLQKGVEGLLLAARLEQGLTLAIDRLIHLRGGGEPFVAPAARQAKQQGTQQGWQQAAEVGDRTEHDWK